MEESLRSGVSAEKEDRAINEDSDATSAANPEGDGSFGSDTSILFVVSDTTAMAIDKKRETERDLEQDGR